VALPFLACGGDGEGGDPGRLDTGIDESRSLSSVSEAEARQACERTEQTFNARFGPSVIARVGCEGQAAAQTSEPAACRSAANECLAMDASPIEDADVPDFECDGAVMASDCSATVG
jgi:hypothetical protein